MLLALWAPASALQASRLHVGIHQLLLSNLTTGSCTGDEATAEMDLTRSCIFIGEGEWQFLRFSAKRNATEPLQTAKNQILTVLVLSLNETVVTTCSCPIVISQASYTNCDVTVSPAVNGSHY